MNLKNLIDRPALRISIAKTVGALVFISLLIEAFSLDRTLADLIYKWEGNQWALKNVWVTAVLIHLGGKYFSIAMLIIAIVMMLASHFVPSWYPWKYRLRYLVTATLLGTIAVSIGKSLSDVACPWDFRRYGGTLEYISLLEQLWLRNGSHCFPAGHASAGFAWVALFFVGLHSNSTWRWWALGFAVLLGGIFGISQQLRGAHFLSHDIWSFGFCWMVSLICYAVMLKPYESTH
jgi:membrane-associated PAP2 superfamily phosphatase